MRVPIASCRCCCAVRRDGRLFPGDIFYIHSRLLERATRLPGTRRRIADRACRSSKPKHRTFRLHPDQPDFHHRRADFTCHHRCSKTGRAACRRCRQTVSRVRRARHSAPPNRAVAGDLKLAYAQFEELETFSRFGPRLDENPARSSTRAAHPRLLKQSNSPVARPRANRRAAGADRETLRRRAAGADAEDAPCASASATIPAEVCARFDQQRKTSDADRETILQMPASPGRLPAQPEPPETPP